MQLLLAMYSGSQLAAVAAPALSSGPKNFVGRRTLEKLFDLNWLQLQQKKIPSGKVNRPIVAAPSEEICERWTAFVFLRLILSPPIVRCLFG